MRCIVHTLGLRARVKRFCRASPGVVAVVGTTCLQQCPCTPLAVRARVEAAPTKDEGQRTCRSTTGLRKVSMPTPA